MRSWILFGLLVGAVAVAYLAILMRADTPPSDTALALEVDVKSGKVRVENADGSQWIDATPGARIAAHPDGTVSERADTAPADSTASDRNRATPPSTDSPPIASHLTLHVVDTEGYALAEGTASIRQVSESYSVELDGGGHAAADALSPGLAHIDVNAASILDGEATQVRLEPGANETEIVVVRRARYRARVFNSDGNAVEGAVAFIEPTTRTQGIPAADLTGRVSDASGAFTYDALVSGAYVLTVSASPYLAHVETVRATHAGEHGSIVLSEQASVMVSVVDESGKPVGGARVTIQSKRGSQHHTIVTQTANLRGESVFENIVAGSYQVSAEHAWYRDDGRGRTDIRVSRSRQAAELVLSERAYSIAGRVYDQQSGEPVPGANVVALSGWKVETEYELGRGYSEHTDGSGATDDDGFYRIEGLRGGVYAVGVGPRDDFVTIPISEVRNFGAPLPLRILLRDETEVTGVDFGMMRSWVVTGRVLLHDGTPLEGATVSLFFGYGYKRGDRDEAYNLGLGTGQGQSGADGSYRYVSDRYAFDHERCDLTIAANHPRHHRLSRKVEIQPQPGQEIAGIDLVFDEQCLVSGRITDIEGEPIAHAYVAFWPLHSSEVTAFTMPDGTYHSALEPGTHAVYVWRQGYESMEIDEPFVAELGKPIEDYDFVLEPGPEDALEGWVSDPDGHPIAGARIILEVQRQLSTDRRSGSSGPGHRTGEDGRFRFTHLDAPVPGDVTYRIRVEATKDYSEAVFETSDRSRDDIHLVVEPYEGGFATVSGAVREKEGVPVERYSVWMIPSRQEAPGLHGAYRRHEITHPDGAFILEDIPVIDGPFMVVAAKGESAPAFSESIVLQRDEFRDGIVIRLSAPFSVSGRVVDGEGYLVQNATVLFQAGGERLDSEAARKYLPHATTDRRGRFHLDGIPVTGGYLSVEQFRYVPYEVPVAIGQPGEERDLGDLIMQRRDGPPGGD